MADVTVYGNTNDGFVQGVSVVYATARTVATSFNIAASTFSVGQSFGAPNYTGRVGFLTFDLTPTGIAAPGDVDEILLLLTVITKSVAGSDFNLRGSHASWVDPIDSLNMNDAYAAAISLEDSLIAASTGMTNGVQISSSIMGFSSIFDDWPFIKLALVSDRFLAATVPTGQEQVSFASFDDVDPAKRPQLLVSYTPDVVSISEAHSGTGGLASFG